MIFLTSTMGENYCDNGKFHPRPISTDNNWRNNLKEAIPPMSFGLLIAASPDDYENNDNMCRDMIDSFAMSGIDIAGIYVCDRRNGNALKDMLKKTGFVILSGGHVPTENRFFKEIGLKEQLHDFTGTIIGISAGTMNCAGIVYACPELDGEAVDPNYERYLTGLALTDISVLPHYQQLQAVTLDGMSMVDIALADSHNRAFIAIVDGSYIMIDGGAATLYGEAYAFENGEITKICNKEKTLRLNGDTL